MADLGLTHVALTVSDVDASISFYEKYAHLKVVNHRVDGRVREAAPKEQANRLRHRTTQSDVAWIGDTIHPFVIVLLKMPKVDGALLPESHLGVACESREEVDHNESKLQQLGAQLRAMWGEQKPTQTLIPVPRLALDGMLFEVDAVAVIPNS
jgi:catechol 2,3-dioxygenase-like lactoylglutathione lyase family enzyme